MMIKILTMYPNLMNLYGSNGNIRCLEKHIIEAGNECEVFTADLGDNVNFSDFDLVYIGAGTERSRTRVLSDIKRHKTALWDYIENGGICLFCGNSFEMLGKTITTLDKTEIEALGYFEFFTTELQRRVVKDTVCTCPLIEDKIIGFMNKQSRTTIVPNPLFRVESGSGNAPDRNDEGIHYKNLFASQLSGPILVRNPQLRAYIERTIYNKKGINTLPLYFMHEDRAYKDSLNGLTQK